MATASSVLDVTINIVETGDNKLKSLTSGLKNLGAMAAKIAVGGLALLGTGIAAVGVKLVGLGADAQEMQGKFDTVFRDMAGPVTDVLASFGEEVGRSRFELMGFASTIQDTLVPLGFAREAAADMSVNVVKLATDLGSFNNIPTATVIEDIQSALVGNTETLRKYGVVASQAAIEQFALTSGLWDGEEAMDASTKANAIYQLILESTTDAQGDAARTSGSWTNQMIALKSSLTDTATEIGLGLLPALSPLLAMFSDLAGGLLDTVMEKFRAFEPALALFGDAFERLAAGNVMGFWTRLGEAITSVLDVMGFSDETIEAFQLLWEDLRDVIQSDETAFNKVGDAIGLVLDAMGVNEETLETFANIWDIIGDRVAGQISSWETIDGILREIFPQETVDKLWDIVDWAERLGGGGEGTSALGDLEGAFNRLLGMSDEDIPSFGESVVEMIVSIIDAIDWIVTKIDNLKRGFEVLKVVSSTIWEQMKLNWTGSIATMIGWVEDLKGVIDSLISKIQSIPGFGGGFDGGFTLPGGSDQGFIPPPSGGSGASGVSGPLTSSGTTVNNSYVMNVNGGDVGGLVGEFGAMSSIGGAI